MLTNGHDTVRVKESGATVPVSEKMPSFLTGHSSNKLY
jgi:hypothetical protein